MATLKDFDNWLSGLVRFGRADDHIEGFDGPSSPGEAKRTIRIYTDTNFYNISAIERDGKDGYLGCVASGRKPRAGEDWHRGSDLADGPLTEETWQRILGDIISYEMVKVHKPVEPVADIPKTPAA